MEHACKFVQNIAFERNKINSFCFVRFVSSSRLFVVNKIIGNAINLVDREEGAFSQAQTHTSVNPVFCSVVNISTLC